MLTLLVCWRLIFKKKEEETTTTYTEAVTYLSSLRRFGIRPGLQRTVELLRRLGNPHQANFHVFHIAGTNGKGSVSSMIEAALRAGGYKTGLYTSPALEFFRERIQVDGQPIPEFSVARLVERVKLAVEEMTVEGLDLPTEFEVMTALAFLYYAEEGVDALVLEVGMGGRYDATNVVRCPLVTVVTNVSLDHTEVLGRTVEEIAWNKAGIIKSGVPCITGASDEAQHVLRQVAQDMGVPLIDARAPVITHSTSLHGQQIDLRVDGTTYIGLDLSLLGRHQAQNAVVALEALEAARRHGLSLSNVAIREGLRTARWPGRFEVWDADAPVPVVLDCAHNEASIAALADTLREYFPGRKAVVVLGMLADKEVAQSIQHLLPHMRAAVVTTPRSPRALAADRMAAMLPPALVEAVEPEPEKALVQAHQMLRTGELLLITGSCYVVGPVRRALVTRPLQSRPTSSC